MKRSGRGPAAGALFCFWGPDRLPTVTSAISFRILMISAELQRLTAEMGKTSRKRIATLFLMIAVILSASVLAVYLLTLMVQSAHRKVSQDWETIDALTMALSAVKDAETGQRGYLLVREEEYLKPYTDGVAAVGEKLDAVERLAHQGQLGETLAISVRRLTDAKLKELYDTLELARAGKLDDALKVVHSERGKVVMDELRAIIEVERAEKRRQLAGALAYTRQLTDYRAVLLAGILAVNLGFFIWAYSHIRREISRCQSATDLAMRERELLHVTLSSIGDGVIVTDVDTKILFMNDVAVHLAGWKREEAIGQRCAEVFRIINETSREPVESPVDKVLAQGVIVGLANHTLLIRKDGSEIPIDDSGAPIRKKDGEVRGVVLVFRDFSEQKQAESAIRAARDELLAANASKDHFLAQLSHELRTPLTPVLATLTSWEVSDELPPAFLNDIQMLRRNVELEARLIDDLLDLTRITKGKLHLSPEEADVHELLQAVAGMYQSEIRGKRLRLATLLDAQRRHVKADPGRLQQVFWNILKNATKFTPEGGTIEITTDNSLDGGAIVIRIIDSGIGMTPDTLSRLFKPFEQALDDRVRRQGGLGLGMAISRALIEVQGGTISAASEGEGKGASFTVTLPTIEPASPSVLEAPNPVLASAPPMSATMNILLVEDHADTARVMSRLLKALGHQVKTADTVAAATDILRQLSFDLILSDLGLPDGTGIDLIKRVRETSDIPAIALTGFGMQEDINRCLEAGFDEHLTKPVNFQKLEMLVRRLSQRP